MYEFTSTGELGTPNTRLHIEEATLEPLIVEPNIEFTDRQLQENIFLVPREFKGDTIMAVLKVTPEAQWHFYEKPNSSATMHKDTKSNLERWELDAFTAGKKYWYEFGRYSFGTDRNENPIKGAANAIDTMYLFDRLYGKELVVARGNQDVLFREGTISQNGDAVAYIRQRKQTGKSQVDYFVDSEIVIKKVGTTNDGIKEIKDGYEIPINLTGRLLNRTSSINFSPDGKYLSFVDNERNEERNPQNINNVNTPFLKIVDLENGEVKKVRLAGGIGTVEMPSVWNQKADKVAVVVDLYENGNQRFGRMLQIVNASTGEARKVEIEEENYLQSFDLLPNDEMVIYQTTNIIGDDPKYHHNITVIDFEGNLVARQFINPLVRLNREFVVQPIDDPKKSYLVFSNRISSDNLDRRPWMTLFDVHSGEQKTVGILFESVIDEVFGTDAYGNPISKRTGGR